MLYRLYLILFFVTAISALCGSDEQKVQNCINGIKSEMNQCDSDNKCMCTLMERQISCYSSCLNDEESMSLKSELINRIRDQCNNNNNKYNQNKNKLIQQGNPTVIGDNYPTRAVYYDVNLFPTATDPNPFYKAVSVFQSMPSAGNYKNQPNSHANVFRMDAHYWLLILVFVLCSCAS